jgi:type II secretion system protein C
MNTKNNLSHSAIQNNILNHNIFNHTREVAFDDTTQNDDNFITNKFDKIPCSLNEKIPGKLVGIIFTQNPATRLVSIKEQGFETVDVYKEGQTIIDYENIVLVRIPSENSAQFKKDHKKICVFLDPPSDETKLLPANNTINLSSQFIKNEIGVGFSKLMTSARLEPEIRDGRAIGFKISNISTNSLFDRIKINNGDIILKVNNTDLRDSSKGFALYEAFQNENSIDLEIEHEGQILNKRVVVQ